MKQILLLAILAMFGCKSIQKLHSNTDISKFDNNELIQVIKYNHLDFNYAKLKAGVESPNPELKFNINIEVRMKKNEYIWVAGKILGLEAARILVRPDSVFILNRVNSTYDAYSFQKLVNEINVPLSFSQMQDLTLGNIIFEESIIENKSYSDNILEVQSSNENYNSEFKLNDQLLVVFEKYFDNNSSINIRNENFNQVENKNLAFDRNIKILNDKMDDLEIKIDIKSIEINKIHEIKFDIPSNYVKN